MTLSINDCSSRLPVSLSHVLLLLSRCPPHDGAAVVSKQEHWREAHTHTHTSSLYIKEHRKKKDTCTDWHVGGRQWQQPHATVNTIKKEREKKRGTKDTTPSLASVAKHRQQASFCSSKPRNGIHKKESGREESTGPKGGC